MSFQLWPVSLTSHGLVRFLLFSKSRLMAFQSMMKQECGWFDEDDHSSAGLSARLSGDAGNLQSVSSVCPHEEFSFFFFNAKKICKNVQAIDFPLISLIRMISTFLVSVTLSVVYSVKLTLLFVVAIPLSLIAVVIESK